MIFSGHPMLDILYVLGSIAFFALMIGYVAACERLGTRADGMLSSDSARP